MKEAISVGGRVAVGVNAGVEVQSGVGDRVGRLVGVVVGAIVSAGTERSQAITRSGKRTRSDILFIMKPIDS